MSWAEGELKLHGRISALAAWLLTDDQSPHLCSAQHPEETIQSQEAALADDLKTRWHDGRVRVAALVAPVLFGRAGTAERSEAVRLHIEARSGYCADILMPYRVRPVPRWRGKQPNRVHFSHPVAQESISRMGGPPAQAKTRLFEIDDADKT
jgi:hypothetical protein